MAPRSFDRHNSATWVLSAIAMALLVVAIGLMLFARFNAVNGVILPFLQLAATPGLYPLDPYVTHSIVPNSTIAFALLGQGHIDLTQPGFLIPCYLLVTALSAGALWRLLGRSFAVSDKLLRAALMFALIFADFKLMGFNKSSWLLEHNFSFTFLAAALRFWFLALLLEQRMVAAAALLIPINLLSFKVGWPLVGFTGLALMGLRIWSPRVWGLLAISLLVPGWTALHSGAVLTSEANAQVFATLNQLHAAEDNPFAGPVWQTPLFLAGMGFGLWQLRQLPAQLVVPVGAVLSGSLLVWLAGGLYLTWGEALKPLPLVVLLSPARAMEMAALLVYLLALLVIVRAPGLGGVARSLLVLAAMVLKVTDDGKWMALALALALMALTWVALRHVLAGRQPAVMRWVDRLPITWALAGISVPIALFFALNLSGQRPSYALDPQLGFHDAALSPGAVHMLRQIARQPGDRRIVFVWPQKDWSVTEWNFLARKSGLCADPYYLATPALIRAQTLANAHCTALASGLRQGRVRPDTLLFLQANAASVVVPASTTGALPGWQKARDFGEWVEMAPPPSAVSRRGQ